MYKMIVAIGKAQGAQFGTQYMKKLFMHTEDCFKCNSGLNLFLHRFGGEGNVFSRV